jgi:N-acetylmuramoyl-L-alanine amidase
VGALAASVIASAATAAGIESLAVAGSSESTRLTLELSGPSQASVFTLAHPDRVVIDLKGATLDRKRIKLPAPAGLVSRLRAGPRDGGGLRIVLEVPRHLAPRLAAERDGRRLIVELGAPGTERTALPAAPAVAERSTPAPTRDLVIAVDAGHGGEDPGATGRDGTREKNVTLAVARVLAARINAEPGMRAVLTRSSDVFVPLRERIERAHRAQADLFVSVHADAIADRSVSGSSVYVLSQRGASSEAAKKLADLENASDLVGGVSLDDKDPIIASVLLDLSQSAAMSASMVAAGKVLDELGEVGEVRKQRVQQAGFVVLKSPDIPSMLIESAYITNPTEERRLRDPAHQVRLADAILAGIRRYFHENPPPGTRMAALAANTAPPAGSLGAPPRSLER